jgi:hypothetical protein
MHHDMGVIVICSMYEILYSKIIISEAYYRSVRFIIICLCCGMALRMSPISKRGRERLRELKLREEETARSRGLLFRTIPQTICSQYNTKSK